MRLKLSCKELIFPILVLISFLVWKPIIIFIFPGILIFYLKDFKKKGLSEIFVYTIGLSLSFWICSFWILRFVKIPFTVLFYVVSAACFGCVLYCSCFKKNLSVKINYKEIIIIIVFIIVLLLYISIMRNQIVAAGADMSMHTYIAKLIYEKNGFPLSYRPILPINHFGAYSTGFHSISALISLLSGIPVYRATLLMTGFVYFFFFVCLYAFLRRFYQPLVSIAASLIVTFAGRQPIGYVSWGGNPTIMSISFVIIGLSLIYLFKKKSSLEVILISIVLCASLLTNFVPFLVFAYLYLGIFVFDFFKSKSRKDFVLKHIYILALSLIILSPFIINLSLGSVSEDEMYRNKGREYPTNNPALWNGNLSDSLITIPAYIKNYDGRFIFSLALLGFFFTLFIKRYEALKQLVLLLIIFLLILNSHYWILPFSYVLIPCRIATMALIPFAFFIGGLITLSLKVFFENIMKNEFSAKIFGACALIFLILLSIASFQNSVSRYSFFLRNSKIKSMVTQEDMDAYQWIIENTDEKDIFLNNYGDGGLWIPAVAFRLITDPHNTPAYFDEFSEGIKDAKPSYVYIGNKKVYRKQFYAEQFESKPDEFEPVFSKGDVKIYKIR